MEVEFSLFPHPRSVTDVPAYPATEAALSIIIAGATKQQEVFYPWFTYTASLTKDWFPSVTNYVIRNTYKYMPWKLVIHSTILHTFFRFRVSYMILGMWPCNCFQCCYISLILNTGVTSFISIWLHGSFSLGSVYFITVKKDRLYHCLPLRKLSCHNMSSLSYIFHPSSCKIFFFPLAKWIVLLWIAGWTLPSVLFFSSCVEERAGCKTSTGEKMSLLVFILSCPTFWEGQDLRCTELWMSTRWQ